MQHTVTLNDAHKRFTVDQDKIFPPQETVKRFKDRLKKIDLDILKSTIRIDNGRLNIPIYFSTCGKDAANVIGTKNMLKRLLDQGKKQGELRKDVSTETVTEMLFAIMLGASVIYGTNKSTESLDKSINSVIGYLQELKP